MNQPPENWKLVFKSTSEYEVEVVKALLLDHNIVAESINRHDHMLDALNAAIEIGLFVHQTDFDTARKIIKASEIE